MSTVSASPSRRFGFPFRKATWLKGLFAVAVAAAAVYWYGFSSITVEGVEVRQGDIAAEVMGTGTLEARRKATLSPRIAGRITEISADQGDQVEAGEPLIRLDDEELLQQVEVAKASIEAAAAAIGRFEAERSQAAAILKQATADYSRTEKLVQSNASTVADLDRAREHLDVATAGIARADAAIAEARQQRRVAESTMAYHEARLADTRIVAPFSGLIVRRYRDPGSIAVPGSSVLGLISTDELWVVAWVDETEMSRLEIGQPAQVLFRSEATNEFAGEVARLGREADRETREFIVEVRVNSLDCAGGFTFVSFANDGTDVGNALVIESQIVFIVGVERRGQGG